MTTTFGNWVTSRMTVSAEWWTARFILLIATRVFRLKYSYNLVAVSLCQWRICQAQQAATVVVDPKASTALAASDPAIPAEWLHCTPLQAAERMIAETPKLFPHRQGGKRAREQVGEQTLRQIRWAATLLEKSLPPATPLWKVTEGDIKQVDSYFDQLPISFGKSPTDREPSTTLVDAVAKSANEVGEGTLSPEY